MHAQSGRHKQCEVRMAIPAKKLKMDMDVLARSVMTVYVCHKVNTKLGGWLCATSNHTFHSKSTQEAPSTSNLSL